MQKPNQFYSSPAFKYAAKKYHFREACIGSAVMPSLCLSWLSTLGFSFLFFFHQIVLVFMFSFSFGSCVCFSALKDIIITTTILVKRRSNFMLCFFLFFFFFLQPFSDSNVGLASNNEFQLPRTMKRSRQSFCSCKNLEILKTTSLVL